MKDKLLKIARYLGQNGFYKEADNLKKLASSGLKAESPYGPGYDPDYHPYDAAPALPKGPSGGRNPDRQRFFPGERGHDNYMRGFLAERGRDPGNYAKDYVMDEEDEEDEEVDEEADLEEELAELMQYARDEGLSLRSLLKSPEYSHLKKLFESIHDEE